MKDRVSTLPEFFTEGHYFFQEIAEYDEANIKKRWTPELRPDFNALIETVEKTQPFEAATLEPAVKNFIKERSMKMGQVFPLLRIALAGTMKGPDVFRMIALLGKTETTDRLRRALEVFDEVSNQNT